MKYSSRFFLYAPVGAFLLILFAAGVHWWFAADALSDRLQAMNGREIVPGITLYFGSREITGFPFSLDTEMRDVTISVVTPHGPSQWHTDRFAMHALAYGRDETIFEAAGQQVLHWTRDSGKGRTLVFQIGSMHASAIREHGALLRFDLDIVGFGSRAFTAQRLQFHIRRHLAGFDVVASADGVRFSKADAPNLGRSIALARVDATITDGAALDTLRRGGEKWFKALDRWRAAGGRLQVDHLSFKWNELTINGSGSLSLDDDNAPQGTLDLKIAGLKDFAARARREALAHGPNTGLAGALLDQATGDRLDTTLGFDNGTVSLGNEPADTVTGLY